MSGYCFKEKYLDDAKQFVFRKITGIYVPFVAYSLVFLALHNVFCRLYIYEPTWLYGWKDFAWNTGRIVTRMSHNEGLLGTFWFLKELFWGNIIFYIALNLCKRLHNVAYWALAIGILAIAEIVCAFHLRIPYFNITHTTIFAAFFIAVGYWWKQANWQINKWVILIGGIAVISIELLLLRKVTFVGVNLISLPIYVFPAIAGTMMIFESSKLLVESKNLVSRSILMIFKFVGKHTLPIMALHMLSFKLVSYILIRINNLPIERLADFPVMYDYANAGCVLLYTFVGIFIPLICVWGWQWGLTRVKSVKCNVYEK